MSDLAELTVRDLLPATLDGMDQVVGNELRVLNGRVPRALAGTIAERVNGAVLGVLNLPLLEILAGVWCKASEIRQYRGEGAKGETITLSLAEHDVPVTLHPRVRVAFAGLPAAEIGFQLELTAHFKLAELSIREGYVVEIGRSSAAVSAQLRCGEIPLHKPLGSREVELLRSHGLREPGIKI